jgi:hypothetical protein
MSETAAKTSSPTPSDGLMRALALIISMSAGFVAFFIYASGMPADGQTRPALLFGLSLIGIFVATLIHELGHAIAALLAGWRIIVFAVQPFAIHFPNSNLAIPGKKQFAGRLGYVAAVPASPETLTVTRWMIFVAGGPAGSFCFAAYLAAMAWIFSSAASQSPELRFLTALCAGFALQSACTGITTLLPRQAPSFTTDGWKLRRAWSKPENLPERNVLPWLLALRKYRIRPRDIPQWMVDDIRQRAMSSGTYRPLSDMMEIARLLDEKQPDFRLARQKIEAFRQAHGADDWLCHCDAYVAAFHEGDVDRARRALAVPHAKVRAPELAFAAHAALGAREGNEALTRRHLADMETTLRLNSPFRDKCYADIRRDIEALLRKTKAAWSHTAL